jgi:hypothetical protein
VATTCTENKSPDAGRTDKVSGIVKVARGARDPDSSAEPEMRAWYFVMSLAFLLSGCASVNRSQHLRPGTTYVDSSGSLVEVGSDGKAHKADLPLDQWPMGFGTSR